MSEKMRDGFESWCLANGYTLRPAETNCGIIIEGDYGHPTVQIAWQAWQASRAALVVELPELKSFNASDEPDFAYEVAIDDIKCALDDAGAAYK